MRLRNVYLKSVVTLASGSIFAQLVVVIASPFITRIFTPEDIGIYTYVLMFSFVFTAVINGRYDMSIVSEQNEQRVLPLVKLSLIIALACSAFISIGYGIYLTYISDKYGQYSFTVIFMFLLLISYGLLNTLTSYNNRNREYKLMSSVFVIRTSCQNIGAIILGLFGTGLLGLLVPYTIGQYLGIKRQAKSILPYLERIKKVSGQDMLEVLRSHYRQPLFSAPALLANSFAYSSITLFIGALFDMSIVGFYSISVRVLGLPLSVISGNVSKVFFEEASREYEATGKFIKAFNKTSLFLICLAFPMVFLMMLFAPPLCAFVFGSNWIVAGEYIRILAPMFGLRFIISPLTPGLLIVNKQTNELILQLVLVAAAVGSYIVTKIMSASVETFLFYISISMSFVFIVYYAVIAKWARTEQRRVT